MPTGEPQDWHCSAYPSDQSAEPPDGEACFAGLDEPCTSAQQCHTRMSRIRQRVYRGIQERAAHDDPTMVRLADDYSTPDRILPGRNLPDTSVAPTED